MSKVKTVRESSVEEFESKCNALLEQGYEIIACNCGFVNSEAYDFCDSWMAVLAKKGER